MSDNSKSYNNNNSGNRNQRSQHRNNNEFKPQLKGNIEELGTNVYYLGNV